MDSSPDVKAIVKAISQPSDPWNLDRYVSPHREAMRGLSRMTAEEILMNPFEIGVLTAHKSRALASTQGIVIDTSYDENISFGFIPPGGAGDKPMAILNGTYGSQVFEKANRALAHYLYMYLRVSTWPCVCCSLDSLYLAPQAVTRIGGKISRRGPLTPHWWESTVWARAFYGRNAIYEQPLAQTICDEDQKRGFWFPDITVHGNAKRLEKFWLGEIEDRILSALDPDRLSRGHVISRLAGPSKHTGDRAGANHDQ